MARFCTSAHFRVNKTITVIEGSFSSNLQMALTISVYLSAHLFIYVMVDVQRKTIRSKNFLNEPYSIHTTPKSKSYQK